MLEFEQGTLVLLAAPGWLATAAVAVAVIAAVITYRRYKPVPPGAWGMLAKICRSVAVALLILLLTQPALEQQHAATVQANVAVVIDSSLSMQSHQADVERWADDIATMAQSNEWRLRWYRLGEQLREVDAQAQAVTPANATSSRLGDGLENLVMSSRPDLVIMVSDFRSTAGSELGAIAHRLGQERLPPNGVWAIGLGATTMQPAIHLDEIVGPREVTTGDAYPLIARGSVRAAAGSTITATIHNSDDPGKYLDQQRIVMPEGTDARQLTTVEVPLTLQLETLGLHKLVVTMSDGERQDQLNWPVRAGERGLTILLLAQHPRFEMRYLRAAAERDSMITVHSYLADGGWKRWGDSRHGPASLPSNMLDLERYDCVIIGDIDASRLNQDLQINLRRLVTEQGTGLLWIPGERGATAGFRNAHLGALLPTTLTDAPLIRQGYLDGVLQEPTPTEAALRHQVLIPPDIDWTELAAPIGAAPLGELKPGAEVLLQHTEESHPLVVTRRAGNGRSVIIAIDDTWRWRRWADDRYLHAFHSSLMRFAANNRALGRNPWSLRVSPLRCNPGDLVQLSLQPQGNPDPGLPTVLHAIMTTGEGAFLKEERFSLRRSDDVYHAQIAAPGPGNWNIAIRPDPLLGEVTPVMLQVSIPRAELDDTRLDRAAMETLTRQTGGQVLSAPAIPEATQRPSAPQTPEPASGPLGNDDPLAAIPQLNNQQESRTLQTIWDQPWVLAIFVILLGLDWSIRRWHRLP